MAEEDAETDPDYCDWWCLSCNVGWGDQQCGMTADGQHVACPRCGGATVDAADNDREVVRYG